MSQDYELPPSRPPRSGGFSVRSLLLLCLLFLIGGGAFFYVTVRRLTQEKSKLEHDREVFAREAERASLERDKAAQDATRAIARNRQEDLLAQARAATNTLERVFIENTRIQAEAVALKTSAAGKRVALHPDLVNVARRLYESELPALPLNTVFVSKLESARRIEQQLRGSLGTTYEPDTNLVASIQSASVWGGQVLERLVIVESLLTGLIRDSEIKVAATALSAESPTLQEAIAQRLSVESTARAATIVEKTATVKPVADATLAQAEAQRILDKAKLEAAKMLAEAESEAAKQREQTALKIAKDSIERNKVEVEKEKAANEALKVKLKQKATDPTILATLSPFTTPGYVDLYGKFSPQKKPHSFSGLQNGRALESSELGMQRLVNVAYDRIDKVRPRWTFKRNGVRGWFNNPDEVEMIKQVQQLLIELGPVLVESGQLLP